MKSIPFVLVFLLSISVAGQRKNAAPVVPALSPIETKVAGMKKFPGYFEFYYDEKQDKVFLIIDKFDTEFLYVESLTAGIGSNDIGLDRNQLGSARIVKFERRGSKVLLTQLNYDYRAVSSNEAERKAVQEDLALRGC